MKNNNNNNILVIGGSGFIGSYIVQILIEKKYKVTVLDINHNNILTDKIKFVRGSIEDKKLLNSAMKNQNVVYHLAGISSIEENINSPFNSLDVNINGTLNVINAVIRNKVKKLYFASSLYVYSTKGSFYRIAKQTCENLIEEFSNRNNFKFINLRYGSLYGKRSQEWNGLKYYVSQIIKNKKITYNGNGNERREYINVEDAARMSVDLMKMKYKNCAITITGNQTFTSNDILKLIFEILGLKEKIIFKNINKDNNDHYYITPYRYNPSVSKKIISIESHDIGEGILELIDEIKNSEK